MLVLNRKLISLNQVLSNYVNTICLLKPHLSRQINRSIGFARAVSYWLGLFLDFFQNCLVTRTETHHSATTSYLSLLFIHELYLSCPFSNPTNSFVVLFGSVRLRMTFSMRSRLSEIFCSFVGYQLPFTSSSL